MGPPPTTASSDPRPLVVVSNRLPVSLKVDDKGFAKKVSSGGLVSALSGFQRQGNFSWVGWPGCEVPAAMQDEVAKDLQLDGLKPVFLTGEQEQLYYQQMCNEAIWPLFHYFTDRISFRAAAWQEYVEVNRLFAAAILEDLAPDSRVWIHDFHLMLVPQMLREERPDLEIGFFLHIPWPSSEIYRLLPERKKLLRGLLGADYIAFHTNDYAMHFRTSCQRVIGLDSDPTGLTYESRRIGIGRHPIGIEVDHFRSLVSSEETVQRRQELERRYEGRKVLLGVERLDYSKGIPLKLQAFERLLERRPDLADSVTLLQIIVPSRLQSPEYQSLKSEIEERIGRINGRYGRPGSTPVEYIHRHIPPTELVALYQLADTALVTPIRDGMNLVALEYVLCQENANGILVLSEFAGAAHCLGTALLVNPWNISKTAQTIELALRLTREERDTRMQAMQQRVAAMDCHLWADSFLRRLTLVADQRRADQLSHKRLVGAELTAQRERFEKAPRRVFILDYDGTLQDLKPVPEQARPTTEILELLNDLGRTADCEVHLVSGRAADCLEEWFGHLPIHLCGEHGSLSRTPGGSWQARPALETSWMPAVERILEDVSWEVPGAMVERKRYAIAWHYRNADLEYGLWRASELVMTLEEELHHLGLEVIHGHRVVEVRPKGAHKGHYVKDVLADLPDDAFVLCCGDDRTDEDMYRALEDRPCALTVHVGGLHDAAGYFVQSPREMRLVLSELAQSAPTSKQNPAVAGRPAL